MRFRHKRWHAVPDADEKQKEILTPTASFGCSENLERCINCFKDCCIRADTRQNLKLKQDYTTQRFYVGFLLC
jgi:hypothetical protein